MAPIYKVALIQMTPKALDPVHNFATAFSYIKRAASEGARLVVLPEYHLTAWAPTDPKWLTIATRAPNYISQYQSLAAELCICIVTGTIVTLNPASSKSTPIFHNISTFISSDGTILGSYTKKNLWHPERPHLTSPGRTDEHSVIDTPLGKVGILVCWDLAFPEAFRALVLQGAKIIIIPTYWLATDCSPEGLARNPQAEHLFLKATLVARAFENTCAVVFVNVGGPKSEGYCGLSQVALPLVGAVEGSFDGCEEGMRVVDMDMEILEIAERNYKVREDLGREDWHYGYNHGKG